MTILAILLVLGAAVFHATWNFFAKQAGGGALLVWLADALAGIIFAPVALGFILLVPSRFGWLEVFFITGSAVLHLIYFILLQRGYSVGDLSLVYPLARGTGPLLSIALAIALLGERPSFIALLGALLIAAGVFILTGGTVIFKNSGARWAVAYGLLTGVFIAAYTLWDKQAVSTFLISPILLYYFSILVRTGLLGPFAWQNREKVKLLWQKRRL